MNFIFNQIEDYTLICGYFNAHSISWNCNTKSIRGENIGEILLERKFFVLNDGSITHPCALGKLSQIVVPVTAYLS